MTIPAEPPVADQIPVSGAGAEPQSIAAEPTSTPLFEKSDLVTAIALIVCGPLACLPDRARQSPLCRSIAKKHIGLRGSRAKTLHAVIPLLETKISAEEFENLLLADEYEAVAETWRDYLPWCRPLTGRLMGRTNIDTALAAGRGAVLWQCASGPGNRVALRCLAEAGYKLVLLRRFDHPYSGSRFCRTVMNPIPNHQDEQHLYSVVTLLEDNNADALQALGDHLDANKVVVVAADDGFGAHHEIPFLGGTLRLGLGAPTLAAGRSAPLIPLFCGSDGKHGYEVTAEGPLPAALEQESSRAAQLMAEQFAEILIRYLKHQPRMWEGWFARNTWTSNL